MSPIFELYHVTNPDHLRDLRALEGCMWMAQVTARPLTRRWGRDPLEALERAGEAFARSREGRAILGSRTPYGAP